MAYLDLSRSNLLLLFFLLLSLVLLSLSNSLAVPPNAFSSLAKLPASVPQGIYSRRQELSEAPSAGSSFSAHSSTSPTKETSSPVEFSDFTFSDSRASSVKVAVDTNSQRLLVDTSGENGDPGANGIVNLPTAAGAQVQPLDDLKYDSSTITSTPDPLKTTLDSTIPTSLSPVTVSRTSAPIAYANSTSLYLLVVPSAPKINFSRPTPISSKPTPNTKIDTRWAKSTEHHISIPKWRFRSRPTITGVTIHPTSIPEDLISTFFGDLGWARTKGYVIPVDSKGVSGWLKAVATDEPTSTREPPELNQVSGPMAGPSFPSRLQAPPMNSPMPHNTILPTSESNMTYHDSFKIAAVQAFAQLGVVLLAVLVAVVGAVTFVCFSSIMRWPMKVVHAMRSGDVDMLKAAFVPARFRKWKRGMMPKKERSHELNGFAADPGVGRRYLRGTAEAVFFDGVESSSSSSTYTSSGGFSELSESTISVSTSTSVETAHDIDVPPAVAAINTGSQSKAEGGRLRIVNQGS